MKETQNVLQKFLNFWRKEICQIIMDKLRVHKVCAIKQLIECKGHSLHFLSLYSQQLNPIEECFLKWKTNIKVRNTEDLEE